MSPSLRKQREDRLQQITGVYPVSCEPLANGRSDRQWLDAVLAGGAQIVQLRDKLSDDRNLFEKALLFRKKTEEAGALFIVNNRVDIALASNADGVHLGNSDLPAKEARHIAPDLIIGVSANTVEQAQNALARGASYYNIGPLFPTTTKKGLHHFLGEEAIAQFSQHSPLPFTVMGGIKLNHIEALTASGARKIAVVTALSQAADIQKETVRWQQMIRQNVVR